MHLGGGAWVLVDSCLNPENDEPATLHYLQLLGIDPATAVQLVVVTHWDDDHVGGIASVVEACGNATIACSAALCRKDIIEFVYQQADAGGALGSGVDELRTVLDLTSNRKGIMWAKANLPLHPRPPGDQPAVVALSPSEDAVDRSIQSLIEAATGRQRRVRRRYQAPDGPNGASVATAVRSGDVAMLLGADLERSNNPETGWVAVLNYAKPAVAASAIKVPHHGSCGAHEDEVWEEMVEDDVLAIVTPWTKAGNFLPQQGDLDRLRAATPRLFLTATPSLGRVEKDPAVERLVRRLHGSRINELRGWGHVRARRPVVGGEWSVECGGDACPVEPEG